MKKIITLVFATCLIFVGVCAFAHTSSASQGSICTDTDGGQYPYISGSTSVSDPTGGDMSTSSDTCYSGLTNTLGGSCSGEGCQVLENYCVDTNNDGALDNYNATFYDCPNGCANGACIELPVIPPTTSSTAPSGTLQATDCVIPEGSHGCLSTLTWTTSNPVPGVISTVVTSPSSYVIATANSGTATYSVLDGTRDFFLYHNGIQLAKATGTSTCIAGTVYDGSMCTSAPSFTVTPSYGANGMIVPNTPQTVYQNKTFQFVPLPDTGYKAIMGGTCGGSITVDNLYTTNPITADCTVTASFVPSTAGLIISGVSGPQSLKVGEQGTWSLAATNQNNASLTYSVDFGDSSTVVFQSSSAFTHSYVKAGTYTEIFTVKSANTIQCITTPCPSNEETATVSLSVTVTAVTNICPVVPMSCALGYSSVYTGVDSNGCGLYQCKKDSERDVCCASFGYGSYMIKTPATYSIVPKSQCSVSAGIVGGGKKIVNNAFCKKFTHNRRILKHGFRGDDVRIIQRFFNMKIDGIYGDKIMAKVKEWQKSKGLKPDGIFGEKSWGKSGLEY